MAIIHLSKSVIPGSSMWSLKKLHPQKMLLLVYQQFLEEILPYQDKIVLLPYAEFLLKDEIGKCN